jgi:phosphate transport system permease protein
MSTVLLDAPEAEHPLQSGRRRTSPASVIFAVVLWACLAIACAFLLFLLITIVQKGIGRFDTGLVTNQPSKIRPETAGVEAAFYGTLWMMATTAVLAIPLGIAAAIYLEEYADPLRWWNRLIELNIQNLAAVPSVIYGILALAFIVRGPVSIGAVLLAGAVALALLILPVIIITTREAMRSVPREIRDGSLALGATQWQTTWKQVLPAAVPGIATGSILALSRAIGEAAPLILVGAAAFVTFNPDGVLSRYTTLPNQIATLVPQPGDAFRDLAYAAILLLIIVLLAMNAIAIWLRNRFQRSW